MFHFLLKPCIAPRREQPGDLVGDLGCGSGQQTGHCGAKARSMQLRATHVVNSSEVGLKSVTVFKPFMGRQREGRNKKKGKRSKGAWQK